MVEFCDFLAEYSHARHSRPILEWIRRHSEIGANLRGDSRGASPPLSAFSAFLGVAFLRLLCVLLSASPRLRVKFAACLVPASSGNGGVSPRYEIIFVERCTKQGQATGTAAANWRELLAL